MCFLGKSISKEAKMNYLKNFSLKMFSFFIFFTSIQKSEQDGVTLGVVAGNRLHLGGKSRIG